MLKYGPAYSTFFYGWVQDKVEKIAGFFGSNKVHFVPQSHRFLVFLLPLHNQLTLGDPLTWFKLICILPRDLGQGTHHVHIQFNGMVDSSCLTHSGEREWCYSPALLCDQSICWNVQGDFIAPKSNPQGSFFLGKVAIVFSHNLNWNYSLDHSRKCMQDLASICTVFLASRSSVRIK